jgi:hypothetical protein
MKKQKRIKRLKKTLNVLSKILIDPIQPIIIDFKKDQIHQQKQQQQQSCLEITPCQSDKLELFFDFEWYLQPALEFDNLSPIYFDQPLYD